MKSRVLAVPLIGLALAIPGAATAANTTTTTSKSADTSSATSSGPSWTGRWHKLEDEMDQIFRDSMEKLHLGKSDQTQQQTFGSSIDLRDNDKAYVARIYLPKGDEAKVNVTLKDDTLHVTAGDDKTGHYQESISLPGPVQQDKMKMDRKEGVLVVTIPKQTGAAAAQSTPLPPVATGPDQDTWDRDIVREMQRMQDRMDQLTRDVFANAPSFPDIGNEPLLNSTVKVDEEKDNYIVHFYLPDRDIGNFKVNVDNNNEVRLTASTESKNQTKGTNGSASDYAASHYEEAVTLPGPAHGDRMKVDRKEGVVTVTIPKA